MVLDLATQGRRPGGRIARRGRQGRRVEQGAFPLNQGYAPFSSPQGRGAAPPVAPAASRGEDGRLVSEDPDESGPSVVSQRL